MRIAPEDRALIDEAVAAGRVTRIEPDDVTSQAARSIDLTATVSRPSSGPAPREVRRLGIREALEWAFGTEHARLSHGGLCGYGLPGVGVEYLMLQRGAAGRVDVSPGRSLPADDAQTIAMVVEAELRPDSARRVEELARAGVMPWSPEATPRLEPLDWTCGRGGLWRGRTADARTLGAQGWRPVERVNRRGRKVVEPVLYTPCRWTITSQQLARRRRDHLDWWGDLISIRAALRAVDLRWVEITDRMPPMTPWREGD